MRTLARALFAVALFVAALSLGGPVDRSLEMAGFARAFTESRSLAETPQGKRYLFALIHGHGARRVALGGGRQ